MSNHRGPENVAEGERRCEALVRGKPTCPYYEWMRHDHRCPRPAQQMRTTIAVCYVHARSRNVEPRRAVR